MIKKVRNIALGLLVLAVGYLCGPRYTQPAIVPQGLGMELALHNVEQFVRQKEQSQVLKPDNEARIIWADSTHTQTEYAVVYLHGFSASQEEGNPLHTAFAKRYGCNLLLSRLPFHGVPDTNAYQSITPDTLIDGALQALQVAKTLGKKVILMGCSTGGSLAIYLAAHYPEDVAGLILYSPNIEIASPAAKLLTMPWGKQIAYAVSQGDFHRWTGTPRQKEYWQTTYRIEGLLVVQALVENTMTTDVFKKVNQPIFMGYYYKDEAHQDEVVSVPAMLRFFEQVGTPTHLKRQIAFPEAEAHVIAYHETAKDVEGLKQATFAWADEILQLKPKI